MIRLTFSKAKGIAIALGAFVALGGATATRADNWRSCEKKIAQEQRELDKAIKLFARQKSQE